MLIGKKIANTTISISSDFRNFRINMQTSCWPSKSPNLKVLLQLRHSRCIVRMFMISKYWCKSVRYFGVKRILKSALFWARDDHIFLSRPPCTSSSSVGHRSIPSLEKSDNQNIRFIARREWSEGNVFRILCGRECWLQNKPVFVTRDISTPNSPVVWHASYLNAGQEYFLAICVKAKFFMSSKYTLSLRCVAHGHMGACGVTQ